MKTIDEVVLYGSRLKEILEKHKKWLNNEPDGKCANLTRYELRDIDLCEADLRGAILNNMRLIGIDFRNANLSGADFGGSFIYGCDFEGTNLSMANLNSMRISSSCFRNTNLCQANLKSSILKEVLLENANLKHSLCMATDFRDVNFKNASLENADCRYADFKDSNFENMNIKNVDFSRANLYNITYFKGGNDTIDIPMVCPPEGAFIAWKTVTKYPGRDCLDPEATIKNYLIKLQIPASAKRSSSTSRKCRASKAKVLGIYDIDGNKLKLDHILNSINIDNKDMELDYIVGKTIYPDSFDENRWNECSNGIHFFISQKEARDYIL